MLQHTAYRWLPQQRMWWLQPILEPILWDRFRSPAGRERGWNWLCGGEWCSCCGFLPRHYLKAGTTLQQEDFKKSKLSVPRCVTSNSRPGHLYSSCAVTDLSAVLYCTVLLGRVLQHLGFVHAAQQPFQLEFWPVLTPFRHCAASQQNSLNHSNGFKPAAQLSRRPLKTSLYG